MLKNQQHDLNIMTSSSLSKCFRGVRKDPNRTHQNLKVQFQQFDIHVVYSIRERVVEVEIISFPPGVCMAEQKSRHIQVDEWTDINPSTRPLAVYREREERHVIFI